jgi:hypothetical protein
VDEPDPKWVSDIIAAQTIASASPYCSNMAFHANIYKYGLCGQEIKGLKATPAKRQKY